MDNRKYLLAQKANPSNVVTVTGWANASELVSHGFWKWHKGDGGKEFAQAQAEARKNPGTEGFDKEVPVAVSGGDDDSDEEDEPAGEEPEVADEEPEAVPTVDVPELEDMTIEELREKAVELDLNVDKRLGTKNLISAIRAASEKGE